MAGIRRWLAIASLLAACSGGSSSPPPLQTPLSVRFPIDGVVDFAALPAPRVETLEFLDQLGAGNPTGKVATLRWTIVNDDRHLYIALEWDDDTHDHTFDLMAGPVDFDGVRLTLDVDGNGTWQQDEDARTVIAAAASSQYVDQHATAGDETDAQGDGFGRLAWSPVDGRYQAEFLIPLVQDAPGQDGDLSSATRYNLVLMDHVVLGAGTGNAVGLDGLGVMGANTSGWESLPYVPAALHDHRDPPMGLGGLIAFVSDHEEPKGDIYTFEPATGIVARVTTNPGLFKDNVSLSHDRTRIAFHAAPAKIDYAQYEIYTVGVDGTGLVQVTNNSVLDGHPAWSPDDSHIAYASFRNGPASIIVMTAAGAEVADLTPVGADDNDPDWLPDGRIVFKTDRFSTLPEVRMAVMDGDGSNVLQLTDVPGTSDHDPVADGVFALFERFTKGTDYTIDVDTGFVGWNLVEARLDASSERTILADGWVNWLPVLDPTGQYVAYLKSTGAYTDVHLITRDGIELGRFVPDLTRVRYLDWK